MVKLKNLRGFCGGILKMTVTNDTSIEELVEQIPEAVSYLSRKGIRCIQCGEPIWGTLEEAAREKGFSEDDLIHFIEDLNELGISSR